uniref:Ovule protein n=1 Tax=Heterorhabditis bacteriophora TaxID=37862 RepID=A0A1I7WDR8_HETBA
MKFYINKQGTDFKLSVGTRNHICISTSYYYTFYVFAELKFIYISSKFCCIPDGGVVRVGYETLRLYIKMSIFRSQFESFHIFRALTGVCIFLFYCIYCLS